MNILHHDNSAEYRKLVKWLWEEDHPGDTVTAAANDRETIAALGRFHFDIVLSDFGCLRNPTRFEYENSRGLNILEHMQQNRMTAHFVFFSNRFPDQIQGGLNARGLYLPPEQILYKSADVGQLAADLKRKLFPPRGQGRRWDIGELGTGLRL